MLGRVSDCRLQLARLDAASELAQMSRELIETGLAHSWTAVRIARHIEHAESVVLSARVARCHAGFAVMQFADDSAHLNLLAVRPEYRRRGIARQLLCWLHATAVTAGTFVIALELRATSAAAHAFYSALGYRECGRTAAYYQGLEDAIRMTRDLRVNDGVLRAPNG
jgi:ribosomal protein S18 acetylase RimI-like enzyme